MLLLLSLLACGSGKGLAVVDESSEGGGDLLDVSEFVIRGGLSLNLNILNRKHVPEEGFETDPGDLIAAAADLHELVEDVVRCAQDAEAL